MLKYYSTFIDEWYVANVWWVFWLFLLYLFVSFGRWVWIQKANNKSFFELLNLIQKKENLKFCKKKIKNTFVTKWVYFFFFVIISWILFFWKPGFCVCHESGMLQKAGKDEGFVYFDTRCANVNQPKKEFISNRAAH